MKFETYLLSNSLKSAPESLWFAQGNIQDEPLWVIGAPQEPQSLPDHIRIRAFLKPTLAPKPGPQILYKRVNEAITPGFLFEGQRHFEVVQSLQIYGQTLLDPAGLPWEKDRLLAEISYKVSSRDVLEVEEIFQDQQLVYKPSGTVDEPLWPCGGFYQKGCALSEIEPLVVSLAPKGGATKAMIRPLSTVEEGMLMESVSLALDLKTFLEQGHLRVEIEGESYRSCAVKHRVGEEMFEVVMKRER